MNKGDEFADRIERLLDAALDSLRKGDVDGTTMLVQEAAAESAYYDYLRRHPERAATAPSWSRLTFAAKQRWIARVQP